MACLNSLAMLVSDPVGAAPADFTFDVQEIGPQHSHIAIRLRDTSHGNKPVDGAFCTAVSPPQPGLCVTVAVGFETVSGNMDYFTVATPGPGTGRYTFIMGDPMVPRSLTISAEVPTQVPSQTETLTSVISIQ